MKTAQRRCGAAALRARCGNAACSTSVKRRQSRRRNKEALMLPNHSHSPAPLRASDPAADPPIPDQPAIPDAPSPGRPADVPDVGIPEPEPDRTQPEPGKQPGQ
ncbi:hypothetical protein BTO02_11060 [Paraburkholderia sp. SOS3]|nr:hypothetical protein BTO02_11060 [Paraburkholderia sp. SOS3]